eukprot:906149-Amphidinium_carterae.1
MNTDVPERREVEIPQRAVTGCETPQRILSRLEMHIAKAFAWAGGSQPKISAETEDSSNACCPCLLCRELRAVGFNCFATLVSVLPLHISKQGVGVAPPLLGSALVNSRKRRHAHGGSGWKVKSSTGLQNLNDNVGRIKVLLKTAHITHVGGIRYTERLCPYAVVTISTDPYSPNDIVGVWNSATLRRTANPRWNDKFKFNIRQDFKSLKVELRVFHRGLNRTGRSYFLGRGE